MPILIAFKALGLVTLTMKNFAVFQLMIVEEALLDNGIGFLWCSYFNPDRAM